MFWMVVPAAGGVARAMPMPPSTHSHATAIRQRSRSGLWRVELMGMSSNALIGRSEARTAAGTGGSLRRSGSCLPETLLRESVRGDYCWTFTPKVTTAPCAGASVPIVALIVPLLPAAGPVIVPTLVVGAEAAAELNVV